MRKIIKIILVYSFIAYTEAKAQYSSIHNIYFNNNFLINPAITGINNKINISSCYRTQWIDVNGAPETSYVSLHMPINFLDYGKGKVKPHHGVGIILLNDRIGPFGTFESRLNYAYHIPINSKNKLSVGAAVVMYNSKIDWSKINFLNTTDPVYGEDKFSETALRLNSGVWFYSERYYLGSNIVFTQQNNVQFFNNAGFRFLSETKFQLEGMTMIRVNAEHGITSADIGLRTYNDLIMAGTSYRSNNQMIIYAGFFFGNYDIIYSFDNHNSSYSHEIMVNLKINTKDKKVFCPNYFW